MNLKIFCIYHGTDKLPLFKSDCIQPIQSGTAITGVRQGAWRDDTGDNISHKNPIWAELCVHYWVLKNYLVEHKDESYIGFCHYRRFLDFRFAPLSSVAIVKKFFAAMVLFKNFSQFASTFQRRYSQYEVSRRINGYDVILPGQMNLKQAVLSQYLEAGHSREDMEKAIFIVKKLHPDYSPDIDVVLGGKRAYFWLNFIMRREWMLEFLEWEFEVLFELEKISEWRRPGAQESYALARTPAFLAERLVNVWLTHKLRVDGGKVLERQGLLLVDDPRSFFCLNAGMAWQTISSHFHL